MKLLKKKKFLKRILAFFMLGSIIFIFLSNFLKPKWNYPLFGDNNSESLRTFYRQERGVNDVIFLGTSHCIYGISPMEIYCQEKINSYNLGTSIQQIGTTYYLLKEVLHRQNPKVVIMDVSGLFLIENEDETDIAWRYVLDEMPLGRNKIEATLEYAKTMQNQFEGSEKINYIFPVLFPIIKYHDRWQSLCQNDFEKRNDYYTNGYCMNTNVYNRGVTMEQMNDVAQYLVQTSLWKSENESFCLEEKHLYEAKISEKNKEWLRKIKSVCEENGTELLLVKIPTIDFPQFYPSSWTIYRSEEMKRISNELDIPFLDIMYDTEIEIEIEHDFCDGGRHLNYSGSKKISDYLAEYLVNEYKLVSRQNESMDRKLEFYNKVTEVANLQIEYNLDSYLARLFEKKENYIICIAACDDMNISLTENNIQLLQKLGVQLHEKGRKDSRYSLIALIDSGEKIYESMSNQLIEYCYTTIDGIDIAMKSSGWHGASTAQIYINGVDYACNTRGINFVILDKRTGQIIDSVCFDTYLQEQNCVHRDAFKHLEEYRLKLMKMEY